MDSQPRFTNRLAGESSPYLLQHAHNPVNWYPWGAEAFDAARRENKPVFLSVGYSTCYWCHVMERESFENEQVAQEMNRRFINIKVDREQRPDVDQLYMLAVQLLTRSGGWPMSVWLTPDRRPFYGGTYFPPTDHGGRPGFLTVLRSLADAWDNRREEVDHAADSLLEALRQFSGPDRPQREIRISTAMIDDLVGRSVSDYDRAWGGFGAAPKFPRETLLELLLAYCEMAPANTATKQTIRTMLATTLDRMARGGIRDQLGGGFHRYSTDEKWLVPHFEIMLYDNAMLLGVYASAARLLGKSDFARVARSIADFVLSEMSGADGQFFTAFDAEVDGREGQSYLWTTQQIAEILSSEQAAIFGRMYGLADGPNFADPHHGTGEPETSVLWMPQPLADVAQQLGAMPQRLGEQLRLAREALLDVRKRRKQPSLDTKVLTSWNALMIRGLAIAGAQLDEPRYVEAASRAADYLLHNHRTPDGGLWRSSRDGATSVMGFLDDYAGLSQALLELHRVSADARYLAEAQEIARQMVDRFASSSGAFYFTDASAEEILLRQMVASDSPLPSGNAMAADVMLELEPAAIARQIVWSFAGDLDEHGESLSSLALAAMKYTNRHGQIDVASCDAGRPASVVIAQVRRVDDVHAEVAVEIAAGYHLYGPQAPEGMKSTRLLAPQGVTVDYPPTDGTLPMPDARFAGTYSGRIILAVTWPAMVKRVKAYLEFQACTDTECLPAERVELVL